MPIYKITYYYLATGMEGAHDSQYCGLYEADTARQAIEVAAITRNPGRPDLQAWDMGCLRAELVED